jgi:spore maturation protein CgeB
MYGGGMDQGRASASKLYIDSLLHYKIMVVSQRDNFEGHLRLFEGLVSGALVIHDRMLSIPPGLEENKNIVFFDTQEELKEKVLYYINHPDERLAIARRGRQLAMCQSRTWHRMEQIILGKTVTPCDE